MRLGGQSQVSALIPPVWETWWVLGPVWMGVEDRKSVVTHRSAFSPQRVAVPTELPGPTLCVIVVRSVLFTCYLNNETSVVKTKVICCYKTKEIGLRSKRFNKHRRGIFLLPFAKQYRHLLSGLSKDGRCLQSV